VSQTSTDKPESTHAGDLMSLDFTSFVPSRRPAAPDIGPTTAAGSKVLPPLEFEPRQSAPKTISPVPKNASLAGTLNARVEAALAQIRRVAGTTPVRLDLTRIADVNEAGCAALAGALRTMRGTHCALRLAGAGYLAGLLSSRIEPGRRTGESLWLLLAELQLWLGHREEFERTATAYAATFGVPPPSWETPAPGLCEN
jgi:ABC-type transporter Mla MlaB component